MTVVYLRLKENLYEHGTKLWQLNKKVPHFRTTKLRRKYTDRFRND